MWGSAREILAVRSTRLEMEPDSFTYSFNAIFGAWLISVLRTTNSRGNNCSSSLKAFSLRDFLSSSDFLFALR